LTSSASDEKFVAPNVIILCFYFSQIFPYCQTVKPSTKNVNLSIPSKIQVSLPSTSKITKQEDADIKEDNPSQAELMDRVQAYVESQVSIF